MNLEISCSFTVALLDLDVLVEAGFQHRIVRNRFCLTPLSRAGQQPVLAPGLALHAEAHPHPHRHPHEPPTYHARLPQLGLPSGQTQARGPAPHPHPHPHQPLTYHVQLLLLGLRSGQTPVRGLPLLLLGQSAAVHSPPPGVSARVRFPVQLLARQHALVSVTPSPAL